MKRLFSFKKPVAILFFMVFSFELLFPITNVYALTSGPTQPEVQGFEPIATTNLVDYFSGDFMYNIPLLSIDGYPINIFYHGGVSPEQEASWVGLGWNINAGTINRAVRGIPDDFKGDVVENYLNMKEERNIRAGLSVGAELVGLGEPILNLSANLSANINVSNYRGISADFSHGFGVNIVQGVSIGANVGRGTQSGATVSANGSLNLSNRLFKSTEIVNNGIAEKSFGGIGFSKGYNTRSGAQALSFSYSTPTANKFSFRHGFTLPIGLYNHVPVVGNKSTLRAYSGRFSPGGELFGVFPNASINAMISFLKFDTNGNLPAYGYNYLEKATDKSMLDFTREKDGMFNNTMNYMSIPHLTYDVYSVSGQGISGSFRPFRNDYGSVYDPLVSSSNEIELELSIEAGIGEAFEYGGDVSLSLTEISSGPWADKKRLFKSSQLGSLFENVYFKQSSDLAQVNHEDEILYNDLPLNDLKVAGLPDIKTNANEKRDPRSEVTSVLTNQNADLKEASIQPTIQHYKRDFTHSDWLNNTHYININRVNNQSRKEHHFSEFTQTQTDGTRYVYGIPALNNIEEEHSFAVSRKANNTNGTISFSSTDDSPNNNKGIDHYYNKKTTPAYAHSFLLTSILSTDYVDLTGDGPSDDDLGQYTKFNYSREQSNYGWKAPYGANTAQYSPGMHSDYYDDRASYVKGEREQWHLHSIETKNSLAFFYISERMDGRGSESTLDKSYQLDSIKHYNKNDFLLNGYDAKPIKSVFFKYNYELSPNTPNSVAANGGKLTLKEIYIQHGDSKRNLLNPYQFEYYSQGYTYQVNTSNRWGSYQPMGSPFGYTHEFPFVNQTSQQDHYAKAWSLKSIHLPSGGKIEVDYESDDYAYVQNKEAMEMMAIAGFGGNKNFTSSTELYKNKQIPNNFLYFKRKKEQELGGVSFRENYLGNEQVILTNVRLNVNDNGKSEDIKTYAKVLDVGICPNNQEYGYIELKEVQPKGHPNVKMNPISYSGVNFARHYLPHVIYPGSDPDESDIMNVIKGFLNSIKEVFKIMTNPSVQMLEQGKFKKASLNKSYVRLRSPGLMKKGGGQRVKEIKFFDQWDQLTGGTELQQTYGKRYEYTKLHSNGRDTISSGVASYEPLIGGDENPYRSLDPYIVQQSNTFPPNESVGLYMELPMGESLYPSATVGYSEVREYSIHKDYAKSAQILGVHQYYTAKDFPIKSYSSTLNAEDNISPMSWFMNQHLYKASQHYSLVFNDMHGKPKRASTYRLLNNTQELLSYTHYKYYANGDELVNNVPVLKFQNDGSIAKEYATLGVEVDFTHDVREKMQKAQNHLVYFNLNTFIIPPIPVPIPLAYSRSSRYRYQFNSSVSNKVIQKYGIVKEIEHYQEGALTVVQNEAFDPMTGQALITSVNNEFQDRLYTTMLPAYWTEAKMGSSYYNIGYQDFYSSLVYTDGNISFNPGSKINNYQVGDELILTFRKNSSTEMISEKFWVTGASIVSELNKSLCQYCIDQQLPVNLPGEYDCHLDNLEALLVLEPRDNKNPDWNTNHSLNQVEILNVRSGYRNQLNQIAEEVVSLQSPFDNNKLVSEYKGVIDAKASVYSDLSTPQLYKEDQTNNGNWFDRFNPFINGVQGNYRLIAEYQPHLNREYVANDTRKSGLYNVTSFWTNSNTFNDLTVFGQLFCEEYEVNTYEWIFNLYGLNAFLNSPLFMGSKLIASNLAASNAWVNARTVTKTLSSGEEVENKNALNVFSAAHFTQPGNLPKLVAQHARFDEVMFESFEDAKTLFPEKSTHLIPFSPFLSFNQSITSGDYLRPDSVLSTGVQIVSNIAHSGRSSLKVAASDFSISIPVIENLANHNVITSFLLGENKKYKVQYWIKPIAPTGAELTYVANMTYLKAVSPIIEGWQLVEQEVQPTSSTQNLNIVLPQGFYIDDFRVFPSRAQMKTYVYHPINQRLIASLDEQHFTTFYEYDEEGNLIRTKRETERGIITLSEQRQSLSKY